MEKHYYSLSEHLKERFGEKVYKLSLSGGMTCPNRDGTIGDRGCIFCSESGSGEFCADSEMSISEQIKTAKKLVKNKAKSGKFIAYFQSFSNTYAPVNYLRKIFTEAINNPEIVMLSIATRPDLLSSEVIALLKELSLIKPVSVELGLQTMHEKTADYIRRGYSLPVFEKAVKDLKEAGIETVVHLIIGLPNESEEEIFKTAEYVGSLGINGVKFHMLYVVKGTDLEKDYLSGNVPLFSLEEYTRVLGECIRRIPKSVVIHRITGDGAKKDLIAPLWTADKKKVLNYINREFERISLSQGDKAK
ncbi:MAG: TIGR01212 family radical SAM protein [Oscillospiraceae bacterium]|nr:TIGR01212 family radical SAM protein [Oscillospiraceae bacterium]